MLPRETAEWSDSVRADRVRTLWLASLLLATVGSCWQIWPRRSHDQADKIASDAVIDARWASEWRSTDSPYSTGKPTVQSAGTTTS